MKIAELPSLSVLALDRALQIVCSAAPPIDATCLREHSAALIREIGAANMPLDALDALDALAKVIGFEIVRALVAMRQESTDQLNKLVEKIRAKQVPLPPTK